MQNRNYPAKRREKIRLVLMICFTGVLILATVKLTVVALRQIQRTTGVVTPGHGWLFVQDSLRREPLSDMKTGKINPQNLEETDLLVNRILAGLLITPPGISLFKTDTIIHFAPPDRQGREADALVMQILKEDLGLNQLSDTARQSLEDDLTTLQAETTGGIGIDRFTRKITH